jgi:uncharacterized protein YceK
MKSRIAAVCVVMVSALNLTGCGTVDNMCFPNSQNGQVPMHVYGGVEADVKFLTADDRSANVNKDALGPLKLIYMADLPVSLAADTATLPVTLPVAFYEALAHRTPSSPQPPAQNGMWPGMSDQKPQLLQTQQPTTNGPANPVPASTSPPATQ